MPGWRRALGGCGRRSVTPPISLEKIEIYRGEVAPHFGIVVMGVLDDAQKELLKALGRRRDLDRSFASLSLVNECFDLRDGVVVHRGRDLPQAFSLGK